MAKLASNSVELVFKHGVLTATSEAKRFKTRPDRRFRVDAVQYYNETGLAAEAEDFFDIELKNDADVLASWSTEEDEIPADEVIDLPLNADTKKLVLAAESELTLVLTETEGDDGATLPAGQLIIRGRYL